MTVAIAKRCEQPPGAQHCTHHQRSKHGLAQGDLKLLQSDVATRLLASTVVVPEYADAARRYLGDDDGNAYVTGVDQPGTRMARIAVLADCRPG